MQQEFSSPIGESTFSTIFRYCDSRLSAEFSSPIGESTFSTTCGMRIENLENLEFSSPIGESTFSTKFYKGIVKETYRFRPLSGNLLSLHLLKEEFGIEL